MPSILVSLASDADARHSSLNSESKRGRFVPQVSYNARQFPARPVVLCVEDEPIHLVLRKKVLEREGYEVIGVSTLEDALTALRQAPICATIADHMLPGGDRN